MSSASRYPALTNTTATVLLSGHYDSRGSFGMTRAPGGNDDGSGTISILSIARAISKRGILFHSNVELVAFAGEEQGLLGSRAYARELRAADVNITLMIQADMLAYRKPGEPLQLGIPDVSVILSSFNCQIDLERQQDWLSSRYSTDWEYLCHIQSRIACWLHSCMLQRSPVFL